MVPQGLPDQGEGLDRGLLLTGEEEVGLGSGSSDGNPKVHLAGSLSLEEEMMISAVRLEYSRTAGIGLVLQYNSKGP